MQFVVIRDSIRIACESFGSKRHPHVLFVSGAGAPAEFWPEEFCRELAANSLFIIRYCHRDTGRSTHFDRHYSIDDLLLDMLDILSFFGGSSVHLVGHSMGGYLSQLAMCRFPGRFASVTSISAGPTVSPDVAAELGISGPTEATWRLLQKNKPTGDFVYDLDGWLGVWRFLNGTRRFDEESAKEYTRSLYVGDPRNTQVAVNHIHAMGTVPRSLARELTDARCPFLVIHGTEDPLVPVDNGKASARLVPSSKIHLLQGAGHMFFNNETWTEIGGALIPHIQADN